MGARAYDPRTARWLQRDPIGAASGDPNLYRYCGNDPINQVDPDGTEVEWRDLLDVAGFIPGIGEVADLVNAGLYALEGDWTNAGISALGVLPVLGDAAKAGRLGQKALKLADEWLPPNALYANHPRHATKAPRFLRPWEQEVCETSRQAFRETKRRAGIPVSQSPVRQGGGGEYRWYEYEVPASGGGKQSLVVAHHPADSEHPYPHWEAGPKKPGEQPNPRKRAPRYGGGRDKIRVPYRR